MVHLKQLQEDRARCLRVLYELSGGRTSEGVPIKEICNQLGVSEDAIEGILEYLVNAGLARWSTFGHCGITVEGMSQVEESLMAGDRAVSREVPEIFVSHSSADREFAEAVVQLLGVALVGTHQILCTSVPGHRLEAGAELDEALREKVASAKVMIVLVTPTSMSSPYVLTEVGARWQTEEHLVPLLAPGVQASALVGPLAGLNALRSDRDLSQLVHEVADRLGVEAASPSDYQEQVDKMLALPRVAEPQEKEMALSASGGVDPDSEAYRLRRGVYDRLRNVLAEITVFGDASNQLLNELGAARVDSEFLFSEDVLWMIDEWVEEASRLHTNRVMLKDRFLDLKERSRRAGESTQIMSFFRVQYRRSQAVFKPYLQIR